MSDNKNPLVSSIPMIMPLLVIGGLLGYLMASGLVSEEIVKAAVYALVFGIGGAVLGLLLQLSKRVAQTQQNAENVQTDLGNAVSEAVTKTYADFAETLKSTEKSLVKLTSEVSSSLGGHTSSLDNTVNTLTAQMSDSYSGGAAEIKSALSSHAALLNNAGTNWSSEIMAAFREHAAMIQSGVEALSDAETQWKDSLDKSLNNHTDRIASTTEALSRNLSAISDVSKNIEKMLHIQQAIDGALSTMNKSDDFQATITRLSQHLEESDKLLKKAAKPRHIQLVESRIEKS